MAGTRLVLGPHHRIDVNFSVGTTGNDSLANLTSPSIHEVISDFSSRMFVYHEPGNAALIGCYVPLFLLAAVSNALVIGVVSKYNHMRSVTNYFLVNLSIADLLVTFICMPMAVGQAINRLWLYGNAMCKLTYYLQGVSVGASVFTITAMSIDRYLAIRHPIAFRKVFNRRSTLMVIVALWVVALAVFVPLLWVRQTNVLVVGGSDKTISFCVEHWNTEDERRLYGIFCFVLVYAVPGSVVVLAYALMGRRLCAASLLQQLDAGAGPGVSRHQAGGERLVRERRRVARILLLLAVLFALCWLPYNILALLLDLDESRPETERLLRLFPFTLLLGHANSAINPLLYCFLTRNFRNTVRQLLSPLCSCSCCPSRRRARAPAASPPLDAYVCSTHRGGRFKQQRPVYAHAAGGANGIPGSSELIELRGPLRNAGSAPGLVANCSMSSYARGGRAAGCHSSSSGYDSCPAALQAGGSGALGHTQSTCTLAATTTVDHSPHRRCFLLRHPRLYSGGGADLVPVSAQQCHL